ncbi:hypothetical protein P3X46_018043 [Hevea brasiliensis]|uniref:HMA domain-containing protein n=1 Tax=Hevea brasiliensis TaxID=3981 RepID=A0ABQ9LTJ2_HEVBR|nr:heavy metal-associated isoprenylated plant protein 16 isoform X2 [Hevea brasiliensis]KAJ9169896.1 hypothetical protein P3X46_018043 [Hevea brasiliensis]
MTKQKLVIKVSMDGSDKTRSKALRIVVGIYGVQSAAVGEKDKNELEVIGEGIDPVKVTTSLRKRLAKWPFLTCLLPNTMVYAELVSLSDVKEEKEKKEEPKPQPPPEWSYTIPSYPMPPYYICEI